MRSVLIFVFRLVSAPLLALSLQAMETPAIYAPLGHVGAVRAIVFAPQGELVATGGMDNSLLLWDGATGREIRAFNGHTSLITALAFSPDGRYLASGSEDATTRIWDVATGRQVGIFADLRATALVFTPGGELLSGDFLGAVTRLDIPAGRQRTLNASSKGKIRTLACLQAGRELLVGTDAGFLVLDLGTGGVLRTFGAQPEPRLENRATAVSRDGSLVLMAGENEIKIWDTATGTQLESFKGLKGRAFALAMSPDGRYLCAGGSNDTVQLWETSTRRELRSIYWYRWDYDYGGSGVKSLAFSPDGRHVLAGYGMGRIKRWNLFKEEVIVGGVRDGSAASAAGLVEGDELLSLDGQPVVSWEAFRRLEAVAMGRAIRLAFRRDGVERSVVLQLSAPVPGEKVPSGPSGLIPGGTWDIVLEGPKEGVVSLSLSPDGRQAVSGHRHGHVVLWDFETGRVIRGQKPYTGEASVLFTRKGRFLSSSDEDVTVWDTRAATPVKAFPREDVDPSNRALAATPDGRLAVSGAKAAMAVLDLDSMREVRTLSLNYPTKFAVNVMAVSGDGRVLASGDGKGNVRLWDLATGRELVAMDSGSWVYGLAFTPNSKVLVSGATAYGQIGGGSVATLKSWDPKTGRLLGTFGSYSKSINSVSISADGRAVLTAGEELILWNLADGQRIRTLEGHGEKVVSAVFLGNGRQALSASGDGTMRVWNLDTGKELAQCLFFRDGEWAVVTPEGYFNASANGAKHLCVRIGNAVSGIDQFYNRFFRPELVQMALAGLDPAKGERLPELLARMPAPRVRILSPAPGTVDQEEVSLDAQITDQGGGIGEVNLYLNGSQVANDARGLAVKGPATGKDRRVSFKVALVSGPNELRVVAFNQENSMESNPATVILQSRAELRKPMLHALVIGIDEYRNKAITLSYAVADAKAFAEVLGRAAAPLFGQIKVRLLTTPEATTRESITAALEALQAELKPEDLFVFYDASHGVVDTVDGEEQYFLLTSNVLLLSSRHLGADALGQRELARLLGNLPAQKKVIILDTCNAGAGGKAIQSTLLMQGRGLTAATAVKLLQRSVGSSVFSASSDAQAAMEGYKGHGLFTYVLLEGLQGKADLKKDGFITILGLADYLEEQVMALSEEVFKRQQTPIIQTGANFPLGRVQ